jgi:hypothetical protein
VSAKFVLYRRTGDTGRTMWLICTQLAFGEILNRANEGGNTYKREVFAESDDLHLLHKMKDLANEEN